MTRVEQRRINNQIIGFKWVEVSINVLGAREIKFPPSHTDHLAAF